MLVNRPEVSRAIALMYAGSAASVSAMAGFFLSAATSTSMGAAGLLTSAMSVLVVAVLLVLLASLWRTRYILTEGELIIRTTRLIGGSKSVPLEAVRSVTATPIPFGLRLFGASFHGGYYHIPGLGRAFISMTNFDQGLLIRTDRGNYIITPSDREGFKDALEVGARLRRP